MQIDLAKVADLFMTTESTLQDFCTDSEWKKLFSYAKKVAKVNSVEISAAVQSHRQRQAPHHFEDGIICQTTGARNILSSSQNYEANINFPVLDSVLLQSRNQFHHNNIDIMKVISSINPQSKTLLDEAFCTTMN